MTLPTGGRLGPYEILAPLGAGGMGEVYRARDTRLDRSVAIKVLPADFAANASLSARFEREARAISQLNHPNICTIYDVGREGGIEYLVMELLEGETLADRILRGPLPLSEVLRYGTQIAEALAAAHRVGIVHRDLKPGNVMTTRSGAKLLDFGLAKLMQPVSDPLLDAEAATERHDPLTMQGVVIGTIPYMSPEQVQGKPLDHRTDLFSLGAILYEMTTGRRPFAANSREELAAAIVASDPATVQSLRPGAPPALTQIIATSLEKDSVDRAVVLGTIGSTSRSVLVRNVSKPALLADDQLIYVRDGTLMSQHFDLAKGATVGDPRAIASDVFYFAPTGGADFSASATGVVIYRTESSAGRLILRDRKGTEIRTLDGANVFLDGPSLSPDGRKAAVTVRNHNTGWGDIWIYDLARTVRDRFTSDPGMEVYPVWAPDARSIVYSTNQGGAAPHLVRRSLSGASPEEIVPRGTFQIARSFSPDGLALYFSHSNPRTTWSLSRYQTRTRTAEPLFVDAVNADQPTVSPDGTTLAFVGGGTGTMEIYLQKLSDGGTDRIRISDKGGREPRWRRDGQELFFVGGDDHSLMSATPRTPGQWNDPVVSELFRVPAEIVGFDVLPDGRSFLISDGTPGATDSLFHVVVGWK